MKNKLTMHVSKAEAKSVYDAALQLMMGIIGYFFEQKSTINEIIFVPISIMSRIMRTHDAIALLLKNEHYSEAAVLLLTQFELRFDLLYVSSDIKNATAWVAHENPKALNAGMKAKLEKLFKPAEVARLGARCLIRPRELDRFNSKLARYFLSGSASKCFIRRW